MRYADHMSTAAADKRDPRYRPGWRAMKNARPPSSPPSADGVTTGPVGGVGVAANKLKGDEAHEAEDKKTHAH